MKLTSITFITLNAINKHLSHASQMHIHAYKWRVCNLELYSGIQRATWMFMDPCGPQHVYAPCGHIFLLFSMFLFSYFLPKKHYHSLHHWQTFSITTASCMTSPPYILLSFVRTFSPQFTCINQVGTKLYSISIWVLCSLGQPLSKSWNWLHCSLQAFGYYCQRLPRLSTKSIHCYLYSHYFHTRFTFIALRIPPLTPMTQWLTCIDY